MNHDYAHCLDWKPTCPKKCFRAQLVRDLNRNKIRLHGIPISWVHFKGTDECGDTRMRRKEE